MKNDFDILALNDFDIDYSPVVVKPKKKDVDDESEYECTEFTKLTHKVKTSDVFYENAEKLVDDICIEKGDSIFINLSGNFIFGDFIGAFIQKNNLDVEELTIMSLSGNLDNFEMIDELLNKKWVSKVNLILSSYFYRTEKKKHTKSIDFLIESSKNHGNNFNCYYIDTHAKIVLIKTKLGGHVVMSGSSNLRSSQSIEQLIIEDNKDLYESQYSFINKLIS